MLLRPLFAASTMLVLVACKNEPATAPAAATTPVVASADAPAPPASAPSTPPEPSTLVLQHGACYGTCKEHTISITSAGVLTGGKTASLDLGKTRALFAAAAAAFDPAPVCPAMPTDLQRSTLTLVTGGKTLSVQHLKNKPCSPALGEVESQLDSL